MGKHNKPLKCQKFRIQVKNHFFSDSILSNKIVIGDEVLAQPK